jgi:multidrug efflux system outer membrane protein
MNSGPHNPKWFGVMNLRSLTGLTAVTAQTRRVFSRSLLKAWPLGLAVMLAACATPPPALPTADVPDSWQGPIAESSGVWPALDWWQAFNQPELVSYMGLVRTDNLDLANNRRQLAIARLTLSDADWNLWPTPHVDVGYGSQYRDVRGDGVNDRQGSDSAQFGLGLQYTDILKKPGQNRLAHAQYESTLAQSVDTALDAYRIAASTYFQLLFIRDQIRTSGENLRSAEYLLSIIQVRVDNGTITELDALQQKLEVEKQRTDLRNLHQRELAARAALALLVGKRLYEFEVHEETLVDIAVPTVQPGIPSELLLRRPDLVQAEADLRSANANLELARLAYLPTISLTAEGLASSQSLASLLESPTKTLTASATAAQLLLDNGARNRSNKQAQLRLEMGLDHYRKAVLSAMNDVEISLNNIALLDAQGKVASEDRVRAEEAFRIASVRYEQGAVDYQTLLNTQTNLYNTRDNYLQNKLDRLNAMLDFYVSLGGGWQKDNAEATSEILANR